VSAGFEAMHDAFAEAGGSVPYLPCYSPELKPD
jgi:hypothetical protein